MLDRAPAPADRRREANRLAKRAQRKRERRGEYVVKVTVAADGIEALVALGWLGENESEDFHQIGAAISLMFSDVVQHMKKMSSHDRQGAAPGV